MTERATGTSASSRVAAAGHAVASLGPRLPLLLLIFLLVPVSPVLGQETSMGSVMVQVPPVAQMEVEPLDAAVTTTSRAELDGSVRIRVRANHGWEVVVASLTASTGTLWVRSSALGEYRRLEPGAQLAVATGGKGNRVIRIDYRWSKGPNGPADAVPLTYTLASR